MENVTFETMPSFMEKMGEKIDKLENLLLTKLNPQKPKQEKFSLAEAANYCRMAEATFRTYIYKRQVAGIKFGKAWTFMREDLDKFIQDYRRPTTKELEQEAVEKLTAGKRR